jgi:dTDP-4-amino-4,6-dideoxygalactose transaminase
MPPQQRTFFAPTVPGLSIQHLLIKRAALSYFPFNHASVEYFYNARSAIHAAATSFGLRGKEVLFPSYCCGVDLEALVSAGAIPKFYPVDDAMRADVSEIASRVSPDTRAVYVIHYLGFPAPVDELSILCRKQGIRLIEDCALALYSNLGNRPLGSFGDAGVFSLYKSLPVPSGGVLVFNDGSVGRLCPRRRPPVRSTLAHLRMLLERNFDMNGITWAKRLTGMARSTIGIIRPSVTRTPVVEVLTEEFDPRVCRLKTSRFTEWVLRCVDPAHVVSRRRENFMTLHRLLGGMVQPVFDQLPEGVCPLLYAIKVKDNREAMKALRLEGIEAWAWWWPTPKRLEADPCANTRKLRKQVVVIPCHEGITPDGILRVAEGVTRALHRLGESGR